MEASKDTDSPAGSDQTPLEIVSEEGLRPLYIPATSHIDLREARLVEDTESSADMLGISSPLTPNNKLKHQIYLPHQNHPVNVVAVDIGGTLIKLVYFVPNSRMGHPGGKLVCRHFETKKVHECIEYLRVLIEALQCSSPMIVRATGGGAYRFEETFNSELGVEWLIRDEMDCLIKGANFLLNNFTDEAFSCDPKTADKQFVSVREECFPYLLVNIGSGVSILKVDRNSQERISGSSLGGGTFWGLCRLLTGCSSFDEALQMSKSGDNRNVDMLVGDIYGHSYEKIGLSADTIASSLGKIAKSGEEPQSSDSRDRDVTKALLFMISNNIGQIAYLNARLHGITKIYFSGYFIRDHLPTMQALSFGVNFWSGGAIRAYFLKHEGYVGAIGALLPLQSIPSSPEKAINE